MTVGNIVKKARTKLGDSDNTGWSDDILINFVDQGQKDLCKMARIYKRTLYMGLLPHTTQYPLPEDCFQIDRVEYDDTALSVLSREDQDTRYDEKSLHIIKSDINMGTVEVSELIELSNYATFIEGIVIDEYTPIVVDPVLGLVTETDIVGLDMGSELGVVVGFDSNLNEDGDIAEFGDISGVKAGALEQTNSSDSSGFLTELTLAVDDSDSEKSYGFLTSVGDHNAAGTYGVCTDVLAKSVYIKIYYSAISSTVNSLYDALVVKDIWEKALVHYVVGMARQDDNDEGNYVLGTQELDKYDKEVKKAIRLSARSYTSTVSEIKETQYRRV